MGGFKEFYEQNSDALLAKKGSLEDYDADLFYEYDGKTYEANVFLRSKVLTITVGGPSRRFSEEYFRSVALLWLDAPSVDRCTEIRTTNPRTMSLEYNGSIFKVFICDGDVSD